MTDDEPIDVAGLVAPTATRDPYWRRLYATLRAYPGLTPDDRVSRCAGCNDWCLNPDDHGGRADVPRPWASKDKGCQPVCVRCAEKARRCAEKARRCAEKARRCAEPAVPAGYAV